MNSLPKTFIERIHKQLPDAEAFFCALQQPSPVSIRLNPAKLFSVDTELSSCFPTPVPWCNHAYYLNQRPIFTLDPYLHGGAYYVQEASSMFLDSVIKQLFPQKPIRALDLCAAPGGKSTLLTASLPEGSLLISNEVIRSRAAILKENMIKWGHGQILVTNNDPSDFHPFRGCFDLILVDAPCSGEGMFRKEEKAINEWSEKNLQLCSERQKRILEDIWDALKPEGYLIYSTCTYNPEENEKNLEWLLQQKTAEYIPVEHSFTTPVPLRYGYGFYPHRLKGEGFFLGIIRKKDGEEFSVKKEKYKTPSLRLPKEICDFLPDSGGFSLYEKENILGIYPASQEDFIRWAEKHLRVLYKGCELVEINANKWKPLPSFALFGKLDYASCPTYPLDRPNALRYLKKEEIPAPEHSKGWMLVTYQGIGLGWVKSLGNRLNNYYPKEWRIRMDIPEEYC